MRGVGGEVAHRLLKSPRLEFAQPQSLQRPGHAVEFVGAVRAAIPEHDRAEPLDHPEPGLDRPRGRQCLPERRLLVGRAAVELRQRHHELGEFSPLAEPGDIHLRPTGFHTDALRQRKDGSIH